MQTSSRVSLKIFEVNRDLSKTLEQIHEIGFDRVVVCGGDGTLHHVINEMSHLPREKRTALSVMPMGTANDFAHAAAGSTDITLEHCLDSPVLPVDLGVVNGVSFVNVATGGIPAEVTTGADPLMKQIFGKYAYYLRGLAKIPNLHAVEMKFTSGDWKYEGPCFAFTVANAKTAGGGMQVAPDAKVDDGVLDLLIVPEQPIAGVVSLANVLLSENVDLTAQNVITRRVTKVLVETTEDIQLNLDGEPMSGTRFQFEMNCSAIDMAIWNDLLITDMSASSVTSLSGKHQEMHQ